MTSISVAVFRTLSYAIPCPTLPRPDPASPSSHRRRVEGCSRGSRHRGALVCTVPGLTTHLEQEATVGGGRSAVQRSHAGVLYCRTPHAPRTLRPRSRTLKPSHGQPLEKTDNISFSTVHFQPSASIFQHNTRQAVRLPNGGRGVAKLVAFLAVLRN